MGAAEPVVIEVGDVHVELRGAVDRIDEDGAGRAVVIDYKWSKKSSFSKLDDRIATGVDLQLPLYALAVEQRLSRRVIAAGYLTLKDSGERWLRLSPEAPGGRYDVNWEDDRDERMAAFQKLVVARDADIRSGRIDIAPLDRNKCAFCDFADLCRIAEVPRVSVPRVSVPK